VDQREIVARGLVVAGRDGAKPLQVVKEDLDEIALAIELANEAMFDFSLGLRVDDGLHAARADGSDELVRVVTGVADESFPTSVEEQLLGGDHLMALPRRERDVDRAAFGVDDGVEFGRKTSSRAAQSVSFDPPFPPDAS